MMPCVRCGARATSMHHVIYQQRLRDVILTGHSYSQLIKDTRNLVPVCFKCHGAHHNRSAPFSLRVLPDSVFDFAREVLEPGPGYEYLHRRYAGQDDRLDALLAEWEKAA